MSIFSQYDAHSGHQCSDPDNLIIPGPLDLLVSENIHWDSAHYILYAWTHTLGIYEFKRH